MLLEWKEGDTVGFLLTRAGGLSAEASGQILLVRDRERTVIGPAESESIAVRPGDVIEVSMRERYVYVIGAVRYPGPYAHLPSLTAADYVQLAGGPTEIGRGNGWRVRLPDGRETGEIGPETYLVAGSTVRVPERWTYRVSTLLAPISGITALVISVIALRN
jgi:protein involved in polysaccharide export with SLBB domain